jgi:vacuolar protein sorting-associated protein 45
LLFSTYNNHHTTYSEYHLFFTNIITDSQLRDLAEADEHDAIQQVHEFYADYFPEFRTTFKFDFIFHSFFFLIKITTISLDLHSVICVDPESHQYLLGRICDGLAAVLLSLKKKPMIRFQKNSDLCQRVAQGSFSFFFLFFLTLLPLLKFLVLSLIF